MNVFDRIEWLSRRGARFVTLLGLAGLLSLAFATVLDVLLRWILNSPITGVRDAASLFVAIVIACALPNCAAERHHITIRFLGKMLTRRWENILEVFGNLVTLIIFIIMAWQLWRYAGELTAQREVTMVLGWPVWPWWRVVSIIVAYCVPVQAIVVFRAIKSTYSIEIDPD